MKTWIIWLLMLLLMGTTPLAAQDVPDFNDPLFRDHGLVMLLIDPTTGKIIDANNAAGVYYGYSVERLKQMRIQEINTLNRAEVDMEMQRAEIEKRNFFIFRHQLADGSIHPVEVHSSPIIINDKPLLYSVIIDISQRETLLETIAENESRMRYAEQVANFGHWLLDLTTGHYQLSEGATRVLGLDRNSYPAEEIFQMIVPEYRDQLASSHRRLVETNQPYSAVLRFQRPDGTVIDVNSEGNHDETSQQVFGVIRDTTAEQASLRALKSRTILFYFVLGLAVLVQLGVILLLMNANQRRKKTEFQLQQAHVQQLQSEKMASIGQLAAGVAHEINNPIGFVTSNLSSLEKYVAKLNEFTSFLSGKFMDNLDPEQREQVVVRRKQLKIDMVLEDIGDLLAESRDGVERVGKIVQDLKSFSRVDEAKHKMANVVECLESAINISWNEVKYKATLNRDFGDLPDILCYPGQLNQVFVNLLVNAAQAIDCKGTIDLKAWPEGDHVYIRMTDSGCGISAENYQRIFEPFFTTKDVGKGTGLGLSITYDIIKKHQGEIRVDSKLGTGTSFTIKLPVQMNIKGQN